jgi:hypothetical protein
MSRIAFRLSNGQTSKTPTGTPVQVAPQIDQLKGATIFRNCMPNCGCEKGKMDNDEDYGGAMDNARTSGKLNEDGSFKDGFDGCVLHMTSHGHSEESAKKICGKIAQEKLGNTMTFGNFDADRLLTNAKVSGKIDNAGKFNGSEEKCVVYFRNSGASEVSARCLCKKIAKPGKLSNAQSLENVRRAVQAAVNDDSRFKYTDTAYKGAGPGCWVQDFILGENGAPTKAVIMTQNGLVKIGYTMQDDGTVVLDPGPLEKTEQVYNRGKSYQQIVGNIRVSNAKVDKDDRVIVPRAVTVRRHSNSAADIYEQAEKFMNAGKVLPKELNDKLTAKVEEDFPGLIQNAGTSDGVKKAWETRKGKAPVDSEAAEAHEVASKLYQGPRSSDDKINEMRDSAYSAHDVSSKAFKSGDEAQHRQASVAHSIAAGNYKAFGNKMRASEHEAYMQAHLQHATTAHGK